MNQKLVYASVFLVSTILLFITFLDFSSEQEEETFPGVKGSTWEYNCGNPDVFEKIIFQMDSSCIYIQRDVFGSVHTSTGIYRQDENKLGIRFFKGIRNKQINYTIERMPESNKMYFAEKWSDLDIRYFVRKELKSYDEVPQFKNSSWTHSCGNPLFFEKIEFLSDNKVVYSRRVPGQDLIKAEGTYVTNQDGSQVDVKYDSEDRNYKISYRKYQRSSDGEYYIMEKWNDQDIRFFVIDR